MELSEAVVAESEIRKTLYITNIFMRFNGLSFADDPPKRLIDKFKVYFAFGLSFTLIILMLISQIAYTAFLFAGEVSVEQLMRGNIHIVGYGTMSFGKLIMLRYQNKAFRRLMIDLTDIWPGSGVDAASADIKRSSLSALRIMQMVYTFWNVFGVWMYILTPFGLYFYHSLRDEPADIGLMFNLYYPFDQTQVANHTMAFIFEMVGALCSVSAMMSADILFITMASHISMLLRVLQVKIRCIGAAEEPGLQDNYDMIIDVVKIHQTLISYGNDLENAFTVVNLLNVLLSSVNICCVVFIIVLLDPVMEMSNKLYTGAALTQMGVVCWYADDIYRASAGVADAVYESGWYQCDPRSRRALLVMLQRSQRPLFFTALKFRAITMMTYSSILTTAYSYFTLLYTSYSK